jgi:hypothetical protein
MDFQDGGSYFININSTDNFTSVTQFSGNTSFKNESATSHRTVGCETDNADIWFVPPNGEEIECSSIPTTPDDTDETSTWLVATALYTDLTVS